MSYLSLKSKNVVKFCVHISPIFSCWVTYFICLYKKLAVNSDTASVFTLQCGWIICPTNMQFFVMLQETVPELHMRF